MKLPPLRTLLPSLLILFLPVWSRGQTGTALVQHAPSVNGTINGSVQMMTAENVTLNGGANISGDLQVAGTPLVQLNSSPTYSGTLEGNGSTSPSNYTITLNSQAILRHVIRRTNPVTLPTVGTVPTPTGTASVTISAPGQAVTWSNLKNLTLNSNVGQYPVPVGTYGNFSASSSSGFILGVAGATQATVYNFQNLTLNGNSTVQVVGPVVINLANGFSANGLVGASSNPAWLTLNIKSGGFTLNSGCNLYGYLLAPTGTVIINASTQLVGGLASAYLTVNGNGLLKLQPQQAPNQSPTVALTAPANNSSYTAPATFTLTAAASDPDGTVAKVEFFQGTTKIGQSTTAPYSFAVSTLPAGSYSYFARATDNLGATADSAAIAVTVASPDVPPTITLTAPTDGATFTAPATLTVSATAADSDGSVAHVDFYQGTVLIGQSTSAPYHITTSTLSAGTYVFTAKAYDNLNAITTSGKATVTVLNPNAPPTVSITAPADGTSFGSPASFTVTASASDSDGSLTKVEFFQNGTSLGISTTTPYHIGVTGLSVGTYDYVARATDNLGSSTDSAPVRITTTFVNQPPSIVLTAPANGTVFTAPANFNLQATSSDSDGTVTKVEFFQNGTLLGAATTAPYQFPISTLAAGSYSFTARATDNLGATTTTATTAVVVNAPPVVALTNPSSGALFPAPAAITLQASATDSDGTVVKVEFFSGATKLGASTSAPFQLIWNGVGSGSYSVTAVATDNRGATTTSAPVSLTVDAAPSVALTAPSNNAIFNLPATITLQASATDSDGTIAKVEFFAGATKLGETSVAPYQFAWSGMASGTYSLTAKATDNLGLSNVSAPITVKANTAPSVTLTAPANNAIFSAPGNFTLTATASDADGTVAKVEFFQNGTLLGTVTAAPYQLAVSSLTSGSYAFTARATDNLGAATTTGATTVLVNAAPVVSLTAPASGAVFAAPASITLQASASDNDGTVAKVEFFAGSTKLGQSIAAPYQFVWANIASGSYSVTAVATDNLGATTVCTPVSLIVDTPPVIALSSPVNNSTFDFPAAINLQAVATDSDGTVAKVEFFADSTKLGQSVTAPYQFSWSGMAPGNYTLTAKATDNLGLGSMSVAVLVNINLPPVVALTAPANNSIFTAPGNFTLTANATDADGTVTKVEFFQGSTKLGEATAAPYQFTVSALAAGNYSFTARATDNVGSIGTSTPMAVLVNAPPTVFLTAPTTGSVVSTPATFNLVASATDSDGTIAKVEFFNGPTKLGESTSAPFQYTWTNVNSGSYTLTAKATDNLGASTISVPISVIANNPPTVSLTAPAPGAIYPAPASIAIQANATDSDGMVTKVEFFNGPTKLGETLSAPYQFAWTNVAPGTYSVTARATDNRGSIAISAPLTVVVNPPNAPPVVTLSAPANGAFLQPSTPIFFVANATDSDGTVTKVEFFNGVTKLGESTTASTPPSTFSFSVAAGMASGSYSITAVATDNAGATASSAPSTLTINTPPVATPLTLQVTPNVPQSFTLTGTDVDGTPLSFSLVTHPTHGTLAGTPPNLTYTAAPDFGGFDSLTFTANDGQLTSPAATVQLTSGLPPRSRTYTTTADFTGGDMSSISTEVPDQISNKTILTSFDVVWVANSSKGTVAKIDPDTGRVLGEYQTAPDSVSSPYPSRVAVDSKGSAWVANMSDNSIVKIGLPESGAWTDRNGDGVVETSGSLGDVKAWTGTDDVSSATDEAILLFVRTGASGVRQISVDADDNVWVSTPNGEWEKYDGQTGNLLHSEPSLNRGGNGGFVAPSGKLYSAGGNFLVWDTANPIASLPVGESVRANTWASALDSKGNLWCTRDGTPTVAEYSPTGELLGEFYHGEPWGMGIAIDSNDNIWIAHSHCGHTVGHLLPDGTFLGNVEVANHGPVEVSVDRHGRVWVVGTTGLVQRINTLGGSIGSDGVTPIGEVDLSTGNLGGTPWTYGRFTGSTLGLASPDGRWTTVYDGVLANSAWGPVQWSGLICNDAQIVVEAALSSDGITFSPYQTLLVGNSTPTGSGRYLKTRVRLVAATTGETPILYDLTVGTLGYTPPSNASSWFVTSGADIAGNWPDTIQLKAAFCHSVDSFSTVPTYAWSVVSGPGTVKFSDPAALRPTAQFSAVGSYVLRLTATLGSQVSTADLKIALTPYNRAPYVNAGYTTFIASFPPQIWLWGVVRDDGLPSPSVTSTWEKLFGPGVVNFTDSSAPATQASFSVPGVYTLRLKATDGELTGDNTTDVWIGVPPPPPPPSGLVSWWEASGNGDDHISGNQAFLEKGANYSDGKIGGAFHFDGVNDRVRVFASPVLDVGTQDGLTVECWVNPAQERTATLFQYGQGASSGFQIRQLGTSIEANFREANGTNHLLSTGAILTPGTWTHLTASYNRATGEARIFGNGLLRIVQNIGSIQLATNYDIYMGARADTNEPYQGLLDEISVYNRAIYADEVTTIVVQGKRPPVSNLPPVVSAGPELYRQPVNSAVTLAGSISDDGQPINGILTSQWSVIIGPGAVAFADSTQPQTTAVFSSPGSYVLRLRADDGAFYTDATVQVHVDSLYTYETDASLVAWWPGNGDDLDVVHGLKLERFHGTSFGPGQVMQGFTFDGVNNFAYAKGTSETDIGASDAGFTVEFWVKADRASQGDYPLVWWDSLSRGTGSMVYANNAGQNPYMTIYDAVGNGYGLNAGGILAGEAGNWVHLAYTYDKVSGVARVYKNGSMKWESILPTGLTAHTAPDYRLWVGSSPNNYTNFKGGIDELSLYNRPLTPTEISDIYLADSAGKDPFATNAIPTITFVTPASGSTFVVNTPITLGTLAADTDGTVAKVEFFDGVTKIGETTSAQSGQPLAFNLTLNSGLALGYHPLTAVVTDNLGASAVSGEVILKVVPILPVIALTSPVDNATLTAGSSITLDATATYSAGALAKVEFYDGATKLGESTAPTSGSTYEFVAAAGLSAGSHNLTARAIASDSSVATSAPVHITANVVLPVITLTSPTNGSTLVAAVPISLKANATTAQGTITKVEFFDGATKLGERTSPDSSGGSVYTFTVTGGFSAGTHNLSAKATTSTSSTATSAIATITAGNYTGEPTAEISTPDDGARISAPTAITGIVAVPSLTGWALEYRLKVADSAPVEPWTQFASGSNLVGSPAFGATAALAGPLGTFDPTRLINGIYEVQLRATDASLTTYFAGPVTFVVEGNMKVGAFTLAFEDLKVPVSGVPISITRTYDSRDPRVGDFGPGWRIAVNNVRVQKNRDLGAGWYQTPQSGSGIQFYYVDPVIDRIVTVTMPDGESHRFRGGAYVKKRDGDPDNASFAVVNVDGLYKFYPLGDTTSTLEPVDASGTLDNHFWIHGTGDQDLRTDDASDPFAPIYNPTRFRLTTKDGTRFIVDESLGLLQLEDLTGNTLVLNRDAQNRVTSLVSTQAAPSGDIETSVTIHRDATGRVDYIRDPAGKDLDYTYDTSGRLASFVNRELNTTQFKYENASFPYYLTKIIDPRGVTALRSEFDTDGKLIKQIDADGKETVFEHGINVTGRFEKVTDRLGHASTFFYDDRGNVTTKIDQLGAQTTFSYYPDSDWVKFETDHYGNTKSMAYDARGNVIVQTTGASLSEDPANPTTGHTTRTTYNDQSAPTQITDPSGRVQSFTYDPTTNNLLSNTVGVGGAAPATTTYHYNTDGTLDTVTDALGNVTNNTYDYSFTSAAYPSAVKQVTVTVTDPAGSAGSDPANASDTRLRTSRTLYDAQQNMLAQIATRTLPEGGTEDIVTKYLYDSENRLKATIMPDGKVSETRYTSFGQTDQSLLWKSLADYQTGTESLARVTSYGYDNRGNQISTTYPDGSSETTHFDLENRRDWSQDKLGRRTSFQYDDAGRLRFTIEPDATPADLTDNPYTETVYDLTGRVTDTYDELRHRSSVVYYPDGTPEAGRRKQSTQVLSTGNLTTSYSYDASGNVRFVTDPRGNTTETQYDEQGRPTTVIYPATDEHPATQSSTKYNVLGQRIETVDMEGKVARYRYDALGRLFEVRQYLDQTAAPLDTSFALSTLDSRLVSTRYSYDELGHQLTQTDARGNSTNYRYDSLGRRTKRILPDNATETIQYDVWGNLWKRTDFKGYTTTFLYDSLNRLTEKDADPSHPSLIYSHAPDKITYGYDAAGNRTDATVEKGSTVLYVEDTPIDERGRRQFKDTPYGKLTYGYYANSLLKSISSSNTDGVRLGYRYDEANRLAFVDDTANSATRTSSYTYNANGSLETMTAPNAVVHTYAYDSLNRLRTLNVAKGGTTLHSYEYKLRVSGHRQQVIEGAKTTTYTYDDLYRLTSEAISGTGVSPVGSVAYTLDKVGNREARLSSLAPVQNQNNTFNSRDWLSGDTYDTNGNTLTSPVTAYSSPLTVPDVYDFEDHLIIRHKPDGSTVNLSYDADGLLRQKTILSAASLLVSATGYLIDGNNPTGYAQILEERINTTGGTTVKTYAYGSNLISRTLSTANSSPLTAYFTYDGLGSVRELTNQSGAITDAYDYDAFGNLTYHTGTTNNDYLYRGERYESDIGQYYLRARFYNQNTGRFWNQDSYEGSASDPASLHKYLYANADPIGRFDPSGNWTIGEVLLTAGINATISGIISVAFNWNKTGADFWQSVAIDAGIGAVSMPAIGAIAKGLAPLARIALAPLFRMIGSLEPILLTGGKSAIQKLAVNISRFFIRTTTTYPSVESSLMGKYLKMFFPGFDWEMHHIIVQQAWTRAGSAGQFFVDDVLANEGLRRVGNGFLNLVPIPAALNGVLGRSAEATALFATIYYGTAVWGAEFVDSLFDDE